MNKILGIQIFLILLFVSNLAGAKEYNIIDYGATTDVTKLSTAAIQKSIDVCFANGGGIVLVPSGKFLTGTIILKSRVCLKLEKGATLLGSINPKDYIQTKPSYIAYRTATETRQLIYAENQDDISIVGDGTIDGQGAAFIPTPKGNNDIGDEGITRPHLIQFISCTNVKIEDVFLTNSGAWMQHYLACDHLQIRGIRVNNFSNTNNDGIDIDGCHDVLISDCIFESADDGITLKATGPRSCKDIVVTNCTVHSLSNAIKFGTETTGGFQNITITNCTISPVENNKFKYNDPDGSSAISLMINDGGILENVSISHITISETVCPIFIRLGNRSRKYIPGIEIPPVGKVKNITISDIIAISSHQTTSSIVGIQGFDVENIVFDNVRIINKSKGTEEDAKRIIPESSGYPTANMHGDIMPASAFYVRHANNISFINCQLIVEDENVRPAFVFDDARDIIIMHPTILSKKTKVKLFEAKQSDNIKVVEN